MLSLLKAVQLPEEHYCMNLRVYYSKLLRYSCWDIVEI